jgi:hypothetical protein
MEHTLFGHPDLLETLPLGSTGDAADARGRSLLETPPRSPLAPPPTLARATCRSCSVPPGSAGAATAGPARTTPARAATHTCSHRPGRPVERSSGLGRSLLSIPCAAVGLPPRAPLLGVLAA